ncbi:MAG: hypothetical protein WBC88_10580 [Candidatus Zixiibacteriota bacterium]|jgi:hypothetical protein
MSQLFPGANIVAGVLVLAVGFIFHWIGQLISILNWDLATRIGVQEKGMLPEYKVYEHAIAVADVAIGWIYGIAGVGLILGTPWGFKLAWFPGVVLIYHSISFWFWTGNRRRSGHQLTADSVRIGWCLANMITGVLAILVAWTGS